MKSVSAIIGVALVAASVHQSEAFGTSFSGSQLQSGVRSSSTMSMEYIPSGMSKEQWRKIKDQEKNKTKGKNLGQEGITSFKSRSFAEWQKAGGKNLFPVDPKKVKNVKDIPYMQRAGGSADDDDLKKKGGGGGAFNFFGGKKAVAKKEAPAPPKAEEKKSNWWNLNN